MSKLNSVLKKNNLYNPEYGVTVGNLNWIPVKSDILPINPINFTELKPSWRPTTSETLSFNPLQQMTPNQKVLFTPVNSSSSSRYVIRKI